MNVHIFTEADFNTFKLEVENLLNVFGITDYTVEYEHSQIGDCTTARCCYDTRSKAALFQLTVSTEGDYGLLKNVREIAIHEVLHLFLSDLLNTVATTGDMNAPLSRSEEHAVINRLVKILL